MRTTSTLVSVSAALVFPLLLSVPAVAQELRIDGFESGDQVGFQAGFVAGEIGAVRLVTPTDDDHRLESVQILFGPSGQTRTVTLRIYNDNAGTTEPGAQIFSKDFSVTGSAGAFSILGLLEENVIVSRAFRVGIEFQHAGDPAIARDDDGTIDTTANFIKDADFGIWLPSNFYGLTGDWVIRARVQNLNGDVDAGVVIDAGTPVDAGTPDDAGPALDAGKPTDAGAPIDAGTPIDAGEAIDAGVPFDASAPIDAGVDVDAGSEEDAGVADEDAGEIADDGGEIENDAGEVEDDGGEIVEPDDDGGAEPAVEPSAEPEEEVACELNSDCLNGFYCPDDGICAQDCRIDTDCADGTVCDGLGRCVDETEVELPNGCACDASGKGDTALALFGLLALGVAIGRRRRR